MDRTRSFVTNHSLAVFVVLACAFSWWLIPVAGAMLGGGPCIAALVVLSLSKGWPGVRNLLRQIVKWRVSWKWYAAALLLPTTAALVSAVATVGLGAPAPTASELSAWTDPALFFLIALLVPLLFGPWEEPGLQRVRALEIDADPFGARGKRDGGGDHCVLAPAALPPRRHPSR